jgi:hypothetical protein
MQFGRRLKQLHIVNPCRERWDAMTGADTERSCTVCNRSVYDLSALTRRQVADLLSSNGGKVCGRIAYDERGNQIFARERSRIERLMQISVLGVSAVTSAAAAPSCELKVRVVDPAGAVVPKATVKISQAGGTEAVSGGTSNDQGEFSGQIAPGVYSLQVEYAGFVPFRQELTCKRSETVSVNAPLRFGLMGEVVEVKSARFPFGASSARSFTVPNGALTARVTSAR